MLSNTCNISRKIGNCKNNKGYFLLNWVTHHTTAPRALTANSQLSPGISPRGSKAKQGSLLVYRTCCFINSLSDLQLVSHKANFIWCMLDADLGAR